jgi:hypothetical protein
VSALSTFYWLVHLTDGSRQSFGAMLPRMFVLVPVASILGSVLGALVQQKVMRRAG